MPLLKMDNMGNIYEANSARSDGTGAGREVEYVDQTDLTYGNANLKAQQARESFNQQEVATMRAESMIREAQNKKLAEMRAEIKKQQSNNSRRFAHPMFQKMLVEQALRQGITEIKNTEQVGWRHTGKIQNEPIYGVDQYEREQWQLQREIERRKGKGNIPSVQASQDRRVMSLGPKRRG